MSFGRVEVSVRSGIIVIVSNPRLKSVAMPVIRYRCPDCGQEVESFTAQQAAGDSDAYEPVLCPKCQQLHSVDPTNGDVAGEDELGDPW